jgi:hypothetical protein
MRACFPNGKIKSFSTLNSRDMGVVQSTLGVTFDTFMKPKYTVASRVPNPRLCGAEIISFLPFWYFWLTIQNTANRHVSNAFDLLGVFISFPLARCCCCCSSCGFMLLLLRAPTPPRPLFLGEESTK